MVFSPTSTKSGAWTAAANDTVKVADGSTAIGTVTSDASGNWTLATAALADGKHGFTAATTDGGTSAALVVTIDTQVPAAPVAASFSPNTGGIDTTNQVNLVGTSEANSTVTVFDGSTNLGSTTANASGAWSFTESNAANGIHTFTATATDVAGTTAPGSGPLAVTVDDPPSSPLSGNLVVNGGFESGNFTGWTLGGNYAGNTLIATNSEAGTYAAALGPAGADGSLSQTTSVLNFVAKPALIFDGRPVNPLAEDVPDLVRQKRWTAMLGIGAIIRYYLLPILAGEPKSAS